jgi:hypothetical protein
MEGLLSKSHKPNQAHDVGLCSPNAVQFLAILYCQTSLSVAVAAETLRVRVTPDELSAIERKAKSSKQTVSEWIRSILNAAI